MKEKETIIDGKYYHQKPFPPIEGNARLVENSKFDKLVIKGNFTVEATLIVDELWVYGDFIANSNISVGNLYVTGNVMVNGNTFMNGDIHVKGDCILNRFDPRHVRIYVGGAFKADMGMLSNVSSMSVGLPVDFED